MNKPNNHEKHINLVLLLWVFGAFITSAVFSAIIHEVTKGLPPLEVSFFRNLFALIVMLPLLLRYGLKSIKTKKMPLHIIRSLVGGLAMGLWFICLKYIDLSTATMIMFTAPILAVFLASIFLKEKITKYTIIALVLGFGGVAIIKNPMNMQLTKFDIVLFITVVLFAITPLIIRKLSLTESSFSIMFYFGLYMSIFSFFTLFYKWQNPNQIQWIELIALGFIGTIYQFVRNEAIAKTSVTIVSSFQFTEPLFGTLIGSVVFNERIAINFIIGGALVIIAGMISAYGLRRKRKTPATASK